MKRITLFLIVIIALSYSVTAETIGSSTYRTTINIQSPSHLISSATYQTNPSITHTTKLVGSSTYQSFIGRLIVTPIQIFGLVTSCDYTNSTGNWNVDCSDSCRNTEVRDLGGSNVIFTGTGNFITLRDIINVGKVMITPQASCLVTCADGGCFK